jgi:hypothetical protein
MLQRTGQTSATAKTSRLTENKRRYRARRKEYVSDLERRLMEAREQGIRATAEVQLAARKVVEENGRLRGLLRLAGFADEEIGVWARHEPCKDSADGADCARRREMEQKARMCVIFTAGHGGPAMESEEICSSSKSNRKREMDRAKNISESTDTPSSTEGLLVSEPTFPDRPDLDTTTAAGSVPATRYPPAVAQAQARACDDTSIMPCKLLSRLAENPAADITQIPVRSSSAGPPQDAARNGGDVECGKAYEMLMQHATSEDKMDYVARALEGGCASTGKGSCAVKKNVIWGVLDNMCG